MFYSYEKYLEQCYHLDEEPLSQQDWTSFKEQNYD